MIAKAFIPLNFIFERGKICLKVLARFIKLGRLVYNLHCYLVLQVLVEALARFSSKGLVSNECKIYENLRVLYSKFKFNQNLKS